MVSYVNDIFSPNGSQGTCPMSTRNWRPLPPNPQSKHGKQEVSGESEGRLCGHG